MGILHDLVRELRHAGRMLRRAPGHTIPIVVLLAVGIGANAAMFSLFNALFVRGLPVREPERLAVVTPYWSAPDLEDYRRAQTSFTGFAGAGSALGAVVRGDRGERLTAGVGLVTDNYFEVLGVRAALGRFFQPAEPDSVVVIGDSFWRRQFDRDPSVVGRRILLSGAPFTIVGITAPGFDSELPGRVRDIWAPLRLQPVVDPQGDLRSNRRYTWLAGIGRLKEGVSLAQAEGEARSLAGANGRRIRVESARAGLPAFRGRFTVPLQVLAGLVAVILLIVCASVATLLFARGADRRREIAIRQALGASRGRLVRQLILEGLLLAGVAGAIGLAAAPAFARLLLRLQPSTDTFALDLAPDARVLAFALAVSALTALIFTLAPALRASRVTPVRGATQSAPVRRTIRGMVILQTALSVMLVAASFLFAQTLFRLRAVGAGYDRLHIISATVEPRYAGYRDDATQAELGRRLVERLSGIPGVQSASVGLCAVLMGCSRMGVIEPDGQTAEPGAPAVWINPVSPSYFDTAGIPLVEGRSFGPSDRAGAPRVAVVTEALARQYFPGGSAIGRRFTQRTGPGANAGFIEIVGVARDVKFVNPRDPAIRMVFLSAAQVPSPFNYVQVRTGGAPGPLVSTVRAAILEVEPNLYMRGPDTLSDTLDLILSREVLLSRAGSLFGAIALVIACFGTYAVVSFLVTARRAELGIRLAIGAQPRVVHREVIAGAMWTVVPGIALGIGGAWAAGRLIESLLFGVTRQDPGTYAIVAVALLVITAVAAWIPALRASRIDPIEALRAE
jgi:predicted permease